MKLYYSSLDFQIGLVLKISDEVSDLWFRVNVSKLIIFIMVGSHS